MEIRILSHSETTQDNTEMPQICGFLRQLSGTYACLSKGLATNNLGPILKPAKCGLLKLSSIFQLW